MDKIIKNKSSLEADKAVSIDIVPDNNHDNDNDNDDLSDIPNVAPLIYYKKSSMLSKTDTNEHYSNRESYAPVQLTYPEGSMAIGLPKNYIQSTRNNQNIAPHDCVLCSGPPDSQNDLFIRKQLQLMFHFLAIINIILTVALYFSDSYTIDKSKVITVEENLENPAFLPDPYNNINDDNFRSIYVGYFIMNVMTIAFGLVSLLSENAFAIRVYIIVTMIMFFSVVSYLPYMLYFGRYLIDLLQVYIAHQYYRCISSTWVVLERKMNAQTGNIAQS